MKLGIKIAVGIVVLLVAVVVVIMFTIDGIARSAIERGATYALGVQTTLGSADVGITSGEFAMSRLHVANPEGYKSDHFLTLGLGEVAVALGTLRQEIVELPRLALSDIDVQLEKGPGGSNYKVIIDHLKSLQSGADDAGAPDKGGGKRFVIREITITGVNVEAELVPLGGALTKVRIPIDEVRLTNVGSGGSNKRGVSMSELSSVIVEAILSAVASNARDLPVDLANDLGGAIQGLEGLSAMGIGASFRTGDDVVTLLGDEPSRVFEQIGGVGEDVGKTLEGLGGLLGGRKKDE